MKGVGNKSVRSMDNLELELAWKIVERTGSNLFLTGKAGTGKTTFLKNLKEQSKKRMVVLAPTGIAAINAGGVTIHSFFQLPLSPYLPGTTFDRGDRKYFTFSKVKKDIIRTLDLLVIDEISMVRADLLDAVDSVMRRYRDHGKPFGGAQLLMIGDLQQLAPVIKEDEWALLGKVYATPYFFSSKALALAGYHTVELKTVYRQQDAAFISLLNQIRDNCATDATLSELNRRYIPNFKPAGESDYIRLTTHNYQAQAVNDRELAALPGAEYAFEAEVEGTFPETSYPADKRLVLKQGAQVMFIKNDPERRFFNGMIGEVVSVDGENIIVKGKSGAESFNLEKAEWTNSKYTLDNVSKEIRETVEGVFRQYPLRLAWAITIHKSQGLTFDHAIIDASHSFAHGQTYVALSRCRTLDGIVLSAPLQREAIISDDVVDTYINGMDGRTPTADELSALQRGYVVQLLDELFDFQPLQSSFNLLLRTLDEHFYRKFPKLLAEYKRLGMALGELIDVARKFRLQYIRLVENPVHDGGDMLQERVRKAAEYYSAKLSEYVLLCGKTKVSTENKAVRKQYEDRFSTFKDELALKVRLLKHECEDGVHFSVSDYLSTKARILLNISDPSPEPKPVKKAKAPKPAKVSTREVSYRMFCEGMTVAQIAKERGLAESTVFGHLLDYVKTGQIDATRLVAEDHWEEIRRYLLEHPKPGKLSEIKDAVSPSITYDEIRLVVYGVEGEPPVKREPPVQA